MKHFSSLVLSVVVGLGIFASTTHASTTVKAGATCTKLNQVVVVGGYKYTCAKSGSKLLWKKGTQVVVATTTTSITATPISGAFAGTMPAPSHIINLAIPASSSVPSQGSTSFDIPVSITQPASNSNFKAWIYDPANNQKALGSPGIYFQKDGGAWYEVFARTNDGSFDTHLDPGKYLIDVIEPNNDVKNYSRGRYQLTVASNSTVTISGLFANSRGYFTLTALLRNRRVNEIAAFKPTSACQLTDQTGSSSMSNGFPRASGRLPASGTVRALIIPADFTDLPGVGDPRTNYLEMANGTADFYFKESSHRVRFEFSTLSSYVHLNVPVGTYKMGTYNNGDPYSFFMDGLNAAGAQVDLSKYDIAYVLPPPTVNMNQIAYGPAFPGAVDSLDYSNSYGRVLNGVTGGADAYMTVEGAKWKWMAHETGHTFGLYDWYTLDGTNPYGSWDLMSNNWSTTAIELNAWNRYILGWLTDRQIQCQEKSKLTSSTLNFTIESMGVDSQNSKAVMVKLDDSNILVLEARTTAGLDVLNSNNAGVLVYKVDMKVSTIRGMAQTYPRPGGRADLSDAPLRVGESITVQGVKITVTAKQGDSYSVSLSAG